MSEHQADTSRMMCDQFCESSVHFSTGGAVEVGELNDCDWGIGRAPNRGSWGNQIVEGDTAQHHAEGRGLERHRRDTETADGGDAEGNGQRES